MDSRFYDIARGQQNHIVETNSPFNDLATKQLKLLLYRDTAANQFFDVQSRNDTCAAWILFNCN